MEFLIPSIVGVVGLVIGFVIKSFLGNKEAHKAAEEANKKADLAIQEARVTAKRLVSDAEVEAQKLMATAESKNETIKRKKISQAKEKFNQFKAELAEEKIKHREEIKEREVDVVKKEASLGQREAQINKKISEFKKTKTEIEGKEQEITSIRANLDTQIKIIQKKKEELSQANEKHIRALETVANLSEAEAKEQILTAVKEKAENDAMALTKNIISEAKLQGNKEAKKIVIQSIQRMAAEVTIENTVSVFQIESDSIKGQIIGREGRNIRALEAATGSEIVVDDTPEAIIISSFDPIRREICRLSLKKLVADGRIHPARIEEVVAKVRKQLNEQIIEIGERTVIELDIHGLDAELIRYVGRMRFRSSYGQNLLKHSIETANLCALMASEIGLTKNQVKMAKRAGLLHDIGKVAEEESELSHALIGMKLCEKAGEHGVISNAVGAHHDEIEMTNIISPLVQACDAISGARPGARREIVESYLKRITDLEEIAMGFEGVQKAYALQAGRELRVIVESDKVTDQYADDLAFMMSQKIQDEMQYPGQIKVMVIREKRAMSIAR